MVRLHWEVLTNQHNYAHMFAKVSPILIACQFFKCPPIIGHTLTKKQPNHTASSDLYLESHSFVV